jgi:hypothetical protein
VTAGTAPQPQLTFGINGFDSSTTNQPIGYSYDPSGNMTVDPVGPNTMTYDGENRMAAYGLIRQPGRWRVWQPGIGGAKTPCITSS